MTPLVVRSWFSLLRGASSPAAIARAARERGHPACALTDRDNLYGVWEFTEACSHERIEPLVGAELSDPGNGAAAVCLVRDGTGWSNLCRLITRRHTPGFRLEAELPGLSAGLAVLTPDPGLLRAWAGAGFDLSAALPGRVCPTARAALAAARDLNLPAAAVPDAWFADPGDHELHRLLRAIDRNGLLAAVPETETAPADRWLAWPDEYTARFASLPGATETASAIAGRCRFAPPRQVVFPPWDDPDGRTPAAALRERAYAGARRRYGQDLPGPAVERLERELAAIEARGFSAYFLVVDEIVRLSPRTCGRGSGAASLVAYALGITNVCPLRHNLYFERFLNPGRTDPPDIDVDFAWDERDAVIAAVLRRYGERAAMVCSLSRFQPRMAIRETARAFGLTGAEIGAVTRRMPWFWQSDDPEAGLQAQLEGMPQLHGTAFEPPWPEILSLAQRLVGAPRCISVHPGGVVISPGPICRHAPVETAPKGVPVVQWDKDGVEDAGLVKIDLLGNRSLAVIRDALAAASANGVPVDETGWHPEDDRKTQTLIAEGRTIGCFYIESPATRQLQQKAGVGDFGHVVIHSSIIRPAANRYIAEYVRRLRGAAWQPLHPRLAGVLDEAYGIMVYQEDVSRSAMALAGFSHAEADQLRKVIAKKHRAKRLADFERRFADGARERGVDDGTIGRVWEMMLSFSGYSFCKPHSASYAKVSFQAAWLKAHRPAEFMAAVIENRGGFYPTAAYVSEAKRLGLAVRRPDACRDGAGWSGAGGEVRAGLSAVQGVSEATVGRIVRERQRRPFAGLADLLERTGPSIDEARALLHAGALDALEPGPDRIALLWDLLRWQRFRRAGPPSLDLHGATGEQRFVPGRAQPEDERLRRELAVLGFLADRHPIELFAGRLAGLGLSKVAGIPTEEGERARFAGWPVTAKLVVTRRQEPMEFVTFEDETGIVETVLFPDVWRRFCHLLPDGGPLIVEGRVQREYEALTIEARDLAPPPDTDERTDASSRLKDGRNGAGPRDSVRG